MGRQNQREKAEQFRDNLRALIRHQGWTQRDAAKHLGFEYVTLRKYLNMGLANVTAKNRPGLERICQKLGIGKIEFLWASKVKPGRRTLINIEAETESLIFQLQRLLLEYRETPKVERICNAIESAFSGLVLEIKEAKERAKGGSYVDNDTTRKMVHRNRRLGGGRKKYEDD